MDSGRDYNRAAVNRALRDDEGLLECPECGSVIALRRFYGLLITGGIFVYRCSPNYCPICGEDVRKERNEERGRYGSTEEI